MCIVYKLETIFSPRKEKAFEACMLRQQINKTYFFSYGVRKSLKLKQKRTRDKKEKGFVLHARKLHAFL